MSLADTFQFSQSSLQDYVDCNRRFQLRYVLTQPWPALVVAPAGEAEQMMQRGADFHRLVHQHILGMDQEVLEASIHDALLMHWWETYLAHPPQDLPEAQRLPEVVLTAPLAGHRLMAKLDLLAIEPGQRLTIVDWKTMPSPPSRVVLARRMQTRVYRYLVVEAGARHNGGQHALAEQVEMVYWFASSGGDTVQFTYDAEQHSANRDLLVSLIQEISAQQGSIWPLASDQRRCHFCNYRSLCERGVEPAFLKDLDSDLMETEAEFDLEQIAEIEF